MMEPQWWHWHSPRIWERGQIETKRYVLASKRSGEKQNEKWVSLGSDGTLHNDLDFVSYARVWKRRK